jgi:hypothetical protein
MGTPNTGNFVCYYRVSTQRQGRSGLGLDAQKKAELLSAPSWSLEISIVVVDSATKK